MKKGICEPFGNPAEVLEAVEQASAPVGDGEVRAEVLQASVR